MFECDRIAAICDPTAHSLISLVFEPDVAGIIGKNGCFQANIPGPSIFSVAVAALEHQRPTPEAVAAAESPATGISRPNGPSRPSRCRRLAPGSV